MARPEQPEPYLRGVVHPEKKTKKEKKVLITKKYHKQNNKFKLRKTKKTKNKTKKTINYKTKKLQIDYTIKKTPKSKT
jgi:hypothetical protein